MNKVNYQKALDKIIDGHAAKGEVPQLLLHSCCAPCSSYCLTYLAEYFSITVFYYNPNIWPEEEYQKRVAEQRYFLDRFPAKHKISFVEGNYEPEKFYAMAKGMEEMPEGGKRCFACYELRQRKAAEYAVGKGFDYFTTTLSLSPHKNAEKLNEIGLRLASEYGIAWLVSDFKKKGGYSESIRLSKEYGLYRQNYCGCSFSRKEAEQRKEEKGGYLIP